MPKTSRTTVTFVLLIVLSASILFIWNGRSRYHEYLQHQEQLAARAVTAAASEIGLQIEEIKRRVALFADEESELIYRVGSQPEEETPYETLAEKLETHFRSRFAFTIASEKGEPLVYDFDGLIGELCQRDIRVFADMEHPYEVYIHPQPEAYHFDVMSRWQTGDGHRGVFFVSFHPQMVARILANSEFAGHQLIVLLNSDPTLIEVAAQGARNVLEREIRLSQAELQRVGATQPIAGTRWLVADLPGAGLHDQEREEIWRETGMFIVALILIAGVMFRFMVRSDQQRHQVEGRLRRAHHELELRVRDRTQRLTEANEELQAVVKERKQVLRELKEREATLQAILATAVDAIVVINAQAEILIFNGAAERMFGYRDSEVLGQNVKVLMPAPYREEHDDYIAHYQETGEKRIIGIGRRVKGRHKNGTTFPIDLAVSEMDLGRRKLFAGIMRLIAAEQSGA